MTYSTGNIERDKMLRRVIGELVACHEKPTLAAVQENLPRDFDADADEVMGMLIDMKLVEVEHVEPVEPPAKIGPTLTAPPKPLKKIEPPREAQPEPPHEDTADSAPERILSAQEANNAILAASNRVAEARASLTVRRRETATARAALANAITIWQTGLPPYTREQLIRDHLRSEQEKRRQRIEGGIPPQVKIVGKSAIDRAAAYSHDNSPEGAVQSRMQGNGRRRGAYPKNMLHQKNFDPARGPVFKVPGVKA